MRTTSLALLVLMSCAAAGAAAGLRSRAPGALPAGVQALRDIPYGSDPAQRLDVYRPLADGRDRPLIVMVHGGAWRIGDKASGGVTEAKVAAWVPAGAVFVSINYRMLPERDALGQLEDVGRALAYAQAHAREWGASPERVALMGHSAGAHLAALLSADPARAARFGVRPWRGTVVLDSAALDVPALMSRRHMGFYDAAFGDEAARWAQASPLQSLAAGAPPLLLVCANQRRDRPCDAAAAMASVAQRLGVRARVLPQDLGHAEINADLGKPGAYTGAVNDFLREIGVAPGSNGR